MKIFVFGSNREGRHGAGAALTARKLYGAVYGQATGLQGSSYGIVTKELRRGKKPVYLSDIKDGVDKFLVFAAEHPEYEFIVTPIGCGLAGFKPYQIGPLFRLASANVKLPKEFSNYLKS